MKAIETLKSAQNELYSDMNRFTVQAILTYLHHSPMTVDEVFNFQSNITPNITQTEVARKLDELADSGYAKKIGKNSYEPTQKSMDLLNNEGITKQFLMGS
jgi:hypothetical protein